MAGKGPPRTPLKILETRGSGLVKNRFEPDYSDDIGKPPKQIKGGALKYWKRIVPILQGSRVLTEADIEALVVMCLSYETFIEHNTKAEEDGVVQAKQGPYKSPHYQIAQDAYRRWKELCLEFGLTPASRSRVNIPTDAKPKKKRYL